MQFEDMLKAAGTSLSQDQRDIARYEYVWNCAIRKAAGVCQNKANRAIDFKDKRLAEDCAENIMELWHSTLSIR
jgi:hypothetical protein